LHRAHFMQGHGDCQVIDGEFVKSRENCPLLSTRVTQRIACLHIHADETSDQNKPS
jgi:hypothetical protein